MGCARAGQRSDELADVTRAWAPALSYATGSVPFSQLAARAVADVDLRQVGSGTVSGTGLYEVAGFGPLAVAGVLEVLKGAIGPALCGRERPVLGAVAAAAAITGHNWSPWLRGAGGRGLSPALGAMLALAPEGAAVLAAGMVTGRLARQSGLATILAAGALVPFLWRRRGAAGAALACSVVLPIGAKRVLGNAPVTGPDVWKRRAYRLAFDRDLEERRCVRGGSALPSEVEWRYKLPLPGQHGTASRPTGHRPTGHRPTGRI